MGAWAAHVCQNITFESGQQARCVHGPQAFWSDHSGIAVSGGGITVSGGGITVSGGGIAVSGGGITVSGGGIAVSRGGLHGGQQPAGQTKDPH